MKLSNIVQEVDSKITMIKELLEKIKFKVNSK